MPGRLPPPHVSHPSVPSSASPDGARGVPTSDDDGAGSDVRDFGEMSPEEIAAVLVPLFDALPRYRLEEMIPFDEWAASLGVDDVTDDEDSGPAGD